MNTQINVRMSTRLLSSAKTYAKDHGYATVQEFIKETLRDKLFERPDISKEELALVKKLINASDENNLYGTQEQLFKKLKR